MIRIVTQMPMPNHVEFLATTKAPLLGKVGATNLSSVDDVKIYNKQFLYIGIRYLAKSIFSFCFGATEG